MRLFIFSYVLLIVSLVALARALHEGMALTIHAMTIRLVCSALFLCIGYLAIGGFINWWRDRRERSQRAFGWRQFYWRRG